MLLLQRVIWEFLSECAEDESVVCREFSFPRQSDWTNSAKR